MEREVLVRRMAHTVVALAPIYYLLPVDLPYVGFKRWVLLIIFITAMFVFESIRIWKKWTFLGLRPHEAEGLASHAWAAAGLVIVLWLFPKDIASAAIVGWALVDPLLGELRGKKMKQGLVVALSAVAYFALAIVMFLLWNERGVAEIAVLSLVGAAVAIPAEWAEVRYIDDDFMMSVLPAVAMLALSLFVAEL
jgi:dolichol kinase